VKIQHYHCIDGRFFDNAFKQACHDARQQLTFCGVNAHFQNGIAKRSIRDLSKSARKQLLHAGACWPQAVHFALWPYALRNAVLFHNSLPVLEDGTLRLELFSSIRIGSNMKHMHHVACQSTIRETDEDLFHDAHLDLQERMRTLSRSTPR
jgi:hypothetical protein